MARLPEIRSADELPAEQRDLFEYLTKTRGSFRPPFSIIANSPEACRRVSHLGTYSRLGASIPKAVTELATLVGAREFDCAHEWAQHTNFARAAGVSDAAIEAIGFRRPLEGLPAEEALPIEFARQLLQ